MSLREIEPDRDYDYWEYGIDNYHVEIVGNIVRAWDSGKKGAIVISRESAKELLEELAGHYREFNPKS